MTTRDDAIALVVEALASLDRERQWDAPADYTADGAAVVDVLLGQPEVLRALLLVPEAKNADA